MTDAELARLEERLVALKERVEEVRDDVLALRMLPAEVVGLHDRMDDLKRVVSETQVRLQDGLPVTLEQHERRVMEDIDAVRKLCEATQQALESDRNERRDAELAAVKSRRTMITAVAAAVIVPLAALAGKLLGVA